MNDAFIKDGYSYSKKCGSMPKEGHRSVTLKAYRLERIEKYFNDHEAEFRKKGIKSASALIDFWLDEKLIEAPHQ
jgi:hypothetical protein